LTKEMDEPEK